MVVADRDIEHPSVSAEGVGSGSPGDRTHAEAVDVAS